MYYGNYLVHFNQNHDPKNGQFTYGDGDGDGIADDHAHRGVKNRNKSNISLNPIENIRRISYARKINSDDYKRNVDTVVKSGTKLQTISSDENRTKNADMFYASYYKNDNKEYMVVMRKFKVPENMKDENGNDIGTGQFCKKIITNRVSSDMKVASEKTGTEHFRNLYKKDKDFRDFVNNENRLLSYASKLNDKSGAYTNDKARLKKLSKSSNRKLSDSDVDSFYKLFNLSIIYDPYSYDRSDQQGSNDVKKQRAKFFTSLKKDGYSACLDTNDALYNKVKTTSPIIVFDMEKVVPDSVRDLKTSDINSGINTIVARQFFKI